MRVEELVVGEDTLVVLSVPISRGALARLSAAERDVVVGALEGRSNRELSLARGTSIRTIANQLASAFRKLGVKGRAELAARLASVDV
ncbi:MAG: helix-turn-helix transcriptional regulator [Sandaracinus sp.]|nr:helix-turn-helix transcriptional regulator [Sandaracinus sp.]MCB9636524.1 helix-turn-helix transcriptional regulator [Sandaracinus sp.]